VCASVTTARHSPRALDHPERNPSTICLDTSGGVPPRHQNCAFNSTANFRAKIRIGLSARRTGKSAIYFSQACGNNWRLFVNSLCNAFSLLVRQFFC
jgi:hypothetical protein